MGTYIHGPFAGTASLCSWPTARRRPCVFVVFCTFCGEWGGVGLIASCALRSHTHAGLDTFSCNSIGTPQINNFTLVSMSCLLKHVSNVAGAQMLERSFKF